MMTLIENIRKALIRGQNPTLLETIGSYIGTVVGIVFMVLYMYQIFYLFLAIFKRPKTYPAAAQNKRYAVLVAARNEERVLGGLLESLREQTYPRELFDVYVVADNCTDATAELARASGARVFERSNKEQVGKGYALEFLFEKIKQEKGFRAYDAYLVFDADNVLRRDYIEQMHNAYSAGNRLLTCYRNSKNYGKNWVSAGYALWFMRESCHLNAPRSILGTSAAISGTGFLVDSEIIEKNDGWHFFLLTEDVEFTVDNVLKGERVGYCHAAELFDEQPETFKQSFRQRLRWAKGFFQVFGRYGKGLCKGSLTLHWACFDMMMSIMPAFLLTMVQILLTAALLVANLIVYRFFSLTLFVCLFSFLIFGYFLLLAVGIVTILTQWRRIHCNKLRAFWLVLSFPIFMITYIPISFCAVFARVRWQPIEHKYEMRPEDIDAQEKRGIKKSRK